MSKVVVVGSANYDYLVRLEALPVGGETVLAKDLRKQPGGKGANQAVAAARLGAETVFVGNVGDDEDGRQILLRLGSENIDTGDVETVSTSATGTAMISVLGSGENAIVVVPGANAELEPKRVEQVLRRTCDVDSVVVIQAEVSRDVIDTTARVASEIGCRLVLNLAPYVPLSDSTLTVADPLVLNETEASALSGLSVVDRASGEAAALRLLDVARSVVITLGENGAVWASPDASGFAPAPQVDTVVDTTGAGDAFVGALAYRLAQGGDLASGVSLGVAAGSYAVGRPGAQSSYPVLADIATI